MLNCVSSISLTVWSATVTMCSSARASCLARSVDFAIVAASASRRAASRRLADLLLPLEHVRSGSRSPACGPACRSPLAASASACSSSSLAFFSVFDRLLLLLRRRRASCRRGCLGAGHRLRRRRRAARRPCFGASPSSFAICATSSVALRFCSWSCFVGSNGFGIDAACSSSAARRACRFAVLPLLFLDARPRASRSPPAASCSRSSCIWRSRLVDSSSFFSSSSLSEHLLLLVDGLAEVACGRAARALPSSAR